MKKIFTFILTFLTFSLFAQDYPTVSYAGSYAEQAFYSLSDNATTNIDNDSWDVAFSIDGAGIFINESAKVFGAESALYLAPTNNFDDVINPDDLSGRLLNDEKNWDYGAFNAPRDENDPNDFGWGLYDPMTGTFSGNRVFALRFKDGTYQKLQVVSLDQDIYTLRHADLDGNNEAMLTIDKADFPNNHFAYLLLATGQTLENIPEDWDLLFTRYSALLDDGAGGTIAIMTSGVLSAPGVEVAEARGINPESVEYTDYVDSLSSIIDVIGFDWKEFDNVSWSLATDLAYFVKTPTGQVWKIIFLTFDGSSTGDVVFEKTTIVANAVTESSPFDNFGVFPNPMDKNTTAVFSLQQSGRVDIILSNVFGQKIWSGKYDATSGLNAVDLPNMDIPSGTYFLSLHFGGAVVTQKVRK